MSAYKHGTYGTIGKTLGASARLTQMVACIIGLAPIHLVRGYAGKGLVNKPVKLTSYKQAVETIGSTDDWGKFTLCESVEAHLNNPLGSVAPLYIINVFNPDTMRSSTAQTQQLTFINGRAEFASRDIILDTFAIADCAEGTDYALDYDFTAGKVIVTALSELSTVNATYYEADTSSVDAATIVGGVTSGGVYSGIGALELLNNDEHCHASLLAAPGYSHIPAVYNALVNACQQMNGHWMAYCFIDLPLTNNDTIAKAIAVKAAGGYTSEYCTPCWPMVQDAQGRAFHLSTLSVWAQLLAAESHGGVPFETASNKAIPAVKLYFGDGVSNSGYDKERGNELNEHGIRTAVPSDGGFVLWGGHTGAYEFGVTDDARQVFDTNVMMVNYIVNSFQEEWGSTIDQPLTLQLKDEIVNREQDKLDALAARGALIGKPRVTFSATENSTAQMVNGDFTFEHIATPTPQLKSATAVVHYSDDGFSVYTA
mgnify:CR=1 FL=1